MTTWSAPASGTSMGERRVAGVAAMAMLVGAVLVGPSFVGPSQAQAPVVNRDFATEVLGDAWDFSNPEDAPLTDGPPVSLYITDAGFGDGTFDWTSDGGFLDLHPMTVPGALPDHRDGRWNPVDADTYTHVSLRLWASRTTAFRVGWFVCAHDYGGCDRFHDFIVEEGWQTFTLPMKELSADWTGRLLGIRLASGAPEASFRLDWLRIHTADSAVAPPPTAPGPRVLVPSAAGGEDFATTVLGNPWDFDDAGDVAGIGNLQDTRFEGGQFHATNGPPTQNDPWVLLPTGPGVDPARHHLLTVSTTYDGPFSLGFGAGGGMHGRWLFRRADTGPAWADSRELVTFRTRPTLTYDLRDGAFGSTVETGSPGWGGPLVTGLRWDPNEDPGARRWRVDEIRLAAPHESSGLFEVSWQDAAHQPGTTVELGVSRTRGAAAGPARTGVEQQAGVNRARVDLSDLAPGSYWVWVRATAPDGTSSLAWASGELVVTGRLAGADRVATGVALSGVGWPDGSDAVVVASARDFPDALAGAQLADAVGGPLLLTEPGELTQPLAAEVARLDPSEVFVLGGSAAVASAVLDDLEEVAGVAPIRVAGTNRYETAARVADLAEQRWTEAGETVSDEVMLASGASFADALAAGPMAATTRRPLLLTAPTSVPAPTRRALDDRPEAHVVIVGGPAAVAESVDRDLRRDSRRIAGTNRYETARLLADERVADVSVTDRVVVASGTAFPDALGAGAYVSHTGDSLLLTAPTTVPSATSAWLSRDDVAKAVVVGGRAAVDQPTVDAVHAVARS